MSKVKDKTFAESNAKMNTSAESASQEDGRDTLVGCHDQYFMNLAICLVLDENHKKMLQMCWTGEKRGSQGGQMRLLNFDFTAPIGPGITQVSIRLSYSAFLSSFHGRP